MMEGIEKEGHMRYHVESESTPGTFHLVDLQEHHCSCVDFGVRVLARKEKEECRHFILAYEALGREMVAAIRETTKRRQVQNL